MLEGHAYRLLNESSARPEMDPAAMHHELDTAVGVPEEMEAFLPIRTEGTGAPVFLCCFSPPPFQNLPDNKLQVHPEFVSRSCAHALSPRPPACYLLGHTPSTQGHALLAHRIEAHGRKPDWGERSNKRLSRHPGPPSGLPVFASCCAKLPDFL